MKSIRLEVALLVHVPREHEIPSPLNKSKIFRFIRKQVHSRRLQN